MHHFQVWVQNAQGCQVTVMVICLSVRRAVNYANGKAVKGCIVASCAFNRLSQKAQGGMGRPQGFVAAATAGVRLYKNVIFKHFKFLKNTFV